MTPADANIGILRAFVRARWLAVRLRSAERLKSHQRRQLSLWRQHVRAHFPNHDPATLRMSKAGLLADFAAYNQAGITADLVRTHTAASGTDAPALPAGISCGMSTGTTGNRGLYVITDAERYQWLGAILAKALPDVWRRRHRVAVILPQNSALYQAGNQSRWLKVAFYDLRDGPERWSEALTAFNPTTIVAPPKVLRWLAGHADLNRLVPTRLFSAAETLESPDRQAIEAAFAQPLGQIYMATEGLFGVSCRHGTLHLTEDFVQFDFEDGGEGLVMPTVTDFSRRLQLMAGYPMNDLLRLQTAPCPCGSPLQAVAEVVGRQDDVFWFGTTMVTPDILRNAVLDSHPTIDDFRVQQRPDGTLLLRLPPEQPPDVQQQARHALNAALARRGVRVHLDGAPLDQADLFTRKLRRVERLKS